MSTFRSFTQVNQGLVILTPAITAGVKIDNRDDGRQCSGVGFPVNITKTERVANGAKQQITTVTPCPLGAHQDLQTTEVAV